jgi:hypothetical protein
VKLYIAARYDRIGEMADVATRLEDAGHVVTSRWIRGFGKPDADTALYDLTDVVVAEALVLFTEDPSVTVPFAARGGRHVEFGYALRAGKRLFIVGPRENIFHELPDVIACDDVEELLRVLDAVELENAGRAA